MEQFAPLRKGPWSSQRETSTVPKPPPVKGAGDRASISGRIEVIDVSSVRKKRAAEKSKRSHANMAAGNNNGAAADTSKEAEMEVKKPKRGVLDRFKGDKHNRQSDKDTKTNNISPHNSPKSKYHNSSDRKGPRVKDIPTPDCQQQENGDTDSLIYESCDGAVYEQIDDLGPRSDTSDNTTNAKGLAQSLLKSDPVYDKNFPNSDTKINTAAGRVKTMAQSCTINDPPPRNAKKLHKDLPKTKGIVQNGIKKFEGNDGQS